MFTPLLRDDADRIAKAFRLKGCSSVEPIAAGSVNSNFFLNTPQLRVFCRVYEDQEAEGVAYEWALIDHLASAGIPVPRPLEGGPPGSVRHAGKPVALFPVVPGEMICQRGVRARHVRAIGHALGRVHRVASRFGWKRRGRFNERSLRERSLNFPDKFQSLAQRILSYKVPAGLPRSVVHGDLFRDNALFLHGELSAVIDWESASDGVMIYDLAVCVLAWCFGDDFDWSLVEALCWAYQAERPLSADEKTAFFDVLLAAAARFAITRIADFEIRGTSGKSKDYRRFIERIDRLEALGSRAVRARVW